jgi:hypothetical protein
MQKSTTTLYSDFASSQTKFVFYTFTVCLLCFHHICKIPVISILSAQCVQICYRGVFPIISKKTIYTKRQNRIIKMIQIFAKSFHSQTWKTAAIILIISSVINVYVLYSEFSYCVAISKHDWTHTTPLKWRHPSFFHFCFAVQKNQCVFHLFNRFKIS